MRERAEGHTDDVHVHDHVHEHVHEHEHVNDHGSVDDHGNVNDHGHALAPGPWPLLFMPEGDTIYRAAQNLDGALAGKVIRLFSSFVPAIRRADAARLPGQTIDSVTAYGKNLLMFFSGGRVLHSHMRMRGSWHLYRPGERWLKPSHHARVVIEVSDRVAVCFDAPVLRLLDARQSEHDSVLGGLGPDLLDPAFNSEEVTNRLLQHSGVAIGVALLDQRVVAGIGNVYKSEVLFIERVDPFAMAGELPLETIKRLVSTAARLLWRNTGGVGRRTRMSGHGGARLWVYRRSGQPCLRCGTPIEMQRQGQQQRSTYYCPGCQCQ